VVVPALADQRDHRGLRGEQGLQVGIIFATAAAMARAAEGGEAGLPQLETVGAGEEVRVLGIGARPTALDVVDSEVGEAPRDRELVLDGERDVLTLGTVAQRGVVQEDLGHAEPVACRKRDHYPRNAPGAPRADPPRLGRLAPQLVAGRRPCTVTVQGKVAKLVELLC
jgi:hypothetical protein